MLQIHEILTLGRDVADRIDPQEMKKAGKQTAYAVASLWDDEHAFDDLSDAEADETITTLEVKYGTSIVLVKDAPPLAVAALERLRELYRIEEETGEIVE